VLASLIEMILTRRVGRSVYSKCLALPSLLAASCDGRGSACSQDSGSNIRYIKYLVHCTNMGKVELQDIFAA